MQQSESLLSICANKVFLGYVLFSFIGLVFVVVVVSVSTSWEARLGGGFFIVFYGAVFLLLQFSILAIRVDPLPRFLLMAAVVSFVNMVVGVPALAFLFQTVYRWMK